MSKEYQERLFELISKEDVVLFAGAGLSLYAGYPNGNELRDLLWERLNTSEKQNFDRNLNLSILAQSIYDLRGSRNFIIETLREVFKKRPNNVKVHNTISKIPHIKTIITTNYDNLFEYAFGDKCQTLINNSDLAYIDNNKTQLYKIHGDLSFPDSIIIKDSDYNNFFKSNKEGELFWNSVKEKMATKSILFIGYSLEDSNIQILFEKILESLGDDMKERFFVAPNLKQFQIDKLSKKGIKYINSKGEILFPKLLKYLKENTFLNLEKGKVSADTVKDFAFKLGYDIKLGSNKNIAGFYLDDIIHKNKPVKHKVNIKIKNENNVFEKFNSFISGAYSEKFSLKKDELEFLEIYADFFKIKDLDDVEEFHIMKLPDFEGVVDLVFEDGFEIENFNVKVYSSNVSNSQKNFKVINKNFIFEIEVLFIERSMKISFSVKLNDKISDVNSLLNFFQGLNKLSNGVGITILNNGKKVFSESLNEENQDSEYVNFHIEYCELLQKVERFYKMKFKSLILKDINKAKLEDLKKIVAKINNLPYKAKFKPFTAKLIEEVDYGNLTFNEDEMVLFFRFNKYKTVEIHNRKFELGYEEVYIENAIIENYNEFKDRKSDSITVKSNNNEAYIYYKENYEIK